MERERIVREKEMMMVERDSLELKRLRSSHLVTRDLERVSSQMKSVEDSLVECQESAATKDGKREEEFERLTLEK